MRNEIKSTIATITKRKQIELKWFRWAIEQKQYKQQQMTATTKGLMTLFRGRDVKNKIWDFIYFGLNKNN